jgi:hypothetical protein
MIRAWRRVLRHLAILRVDYYSANVSLRDVWRGEGDVCKVGIYPGSGTGSASYRSLVSSGLIEKQEFAWLPYPERSRRRR